MNDLYLAASPPPPVPAPTVQLAPRKVDERNTAQADFEKVLMAMEKEMHAEDVSRTAQIRARRAARSPENSSQGGTDPVEAAVHHSEVKPPKTKEPVRESPKSETDRPDAGTEPTSQAQSGTGSSSDPTAGAGGVVQPVAVAPDKANPIATTAALTAVSLDGAQKASGTTAPAPATTPQVDAAPAAPTDGQPATDVKSSADSGFSQALQQAQKGDGEKGTNAAPAASAADAAQAAAAAQSTTPTVKPGQPVQEAAEKAAPAAQKAVRAVEGAWDAGAQQGVSHNTTGSPSQGMLAQTAELKAAGAAVAVQSADAKIESRALDMIQQVAKTVEASIQQGRNTLRMQLNPADLGALDIRLVSSGHRVSMTIVAEQASTGKMLESQVEQLRQNLANAGVQLSQMHVSQQDAGSAFGRGFAQQQQSNTAGLRQTVTGGPADSETADARQTRMRALGQVDYRV